MFKIALSPEARRIRRIALGDIVHRTARQFGSRTAVVDGALRLSYAALDAQSSQFAHYLLQTVGSGVQVAVLCANSADMLVALNGVHKSGNVWVSVNTMLTAPDIGYILGHSEARCIVADAELCAQPAIAALLGTLALPLVYCRAAAPSTANSHPSLAQACAGQPSSLPEVDIEAEQPALIMYTSGTTGQPKGVVHSHLSIYSAVMLKSPNVSLNEDDVISTILPLFHCAQHSSALSAISVGASLVLVRGFVARQMLTLIAEEKISILIGLPLMYAALLADDGAPAADFSSVRLCLYGMTPMARPLMQAIASRISSNIVLGTGQTEIYPATMTFRPLAHPERDANYWGGSNPVCETAIMDANGQLLPPETIGEIVHRGPNVMLGYFKDPEATQATQRYGWHHTGDIGMFDAGGQLLFLDRQKDIIKTGGENVASIKVEATVLAHPEVANVAAVGLPHPYWSEAISVFILRKPTSQCSAEDILAHCRKHLASFELPKMVEFVDALPITATGKIQKNILRKEYADYWRNRPEPAER